jgi:hypothetical protein
LIGLNTASLSVSSSRIHICRLSNLSTSRFATSGALSHWPRLQDQRLLNYDAIIIICWSVLMIALESRVDPIVWTAKLTGSYNRMLWTW